MSDTHFGRMVYLARMGFNIVPSIVKHGDKGVCTLHMDGKGIRFEPFDGSEPLAISWEQLIENT